MLEINQINLPIEHTKKDLYVKIRKLLRTDCQFSYTIERRSLDARKKPNLFYVYSVTVKIQNEEKVLKRADKSVKSVTKVCYSFPCTVSDLQESERPVIIGFGPCGMFAGLYLARNGFRPIIFERGKCIEDRTLDVKSFWETGILNPSSNVQFGEGGAGAFSDGKLNTLVKDETGKNRAVLSDFVNAGAPSEIEYDYKPHIGTDKLNEVVTNIREEIIGLGGEVHFNTEISEFEIEKGKLRRICSSDGIFDLTGRKVILCIGHSARDTFEKLFSKDVPMKAKSFAVGLRTAHKAEIINNSQYGVPKSDILGNANYKLTATAKDQRGVYSFCMCPGGYIVNASSEEGGLCVNGMSYSGRNGKFSNSAIIVTVNPEDYGNKEPLSGIAFQRELERKAFLMGKGKIPVESLGEFKEKHIDNDFAIPEDCIKGEAVHAPVHQILPQFINDDIVEGFSSFGEKIKGFDADDTLLMGVESRTSSPVRILRNEGGESPVKNLYPAGEGAGFAGGITSAAMDGIFAAENVAIAIVKNRLRKRGLSRRDTIEPQSRTEYAQAVYQKLNELEEFVSAKNVLVYYNFKSEVPTEKMIEQMLLSEKKVFIPKVTEERMDFYQIGDLHETATGFFGIPEPTDFSLEKKYSYEDSTVVLVPGALFDFNGKRIGYGGGFYDRFLSSYPNLKTIGLAFEAQMVEKIDINSKKDIDMDYVVTQERIYSKNE